MSVRFPVRNRRPYPCVTHETARLDYPPTDSAPPDFKHHNRHGKAPIMFQNLITDFQARGKATQRVALAALGAAGVALILASGAVLTTDVPVPEQTVPTCTVGAAA